jgi:acetyl-CoA carboxylase biotin carboxyl carrier protein
MAPSRLIRAFPNCPANVLFIEKAQTLKDAISMAVEVKADVTGKVWKIEAKPGDALEEEDPIIILESMKMEIPVSAPTDGKVVAILVEEGDAVTEGQAIATFEN